MKFLILLFTSVIAFGGPQRGVLQQASYVLDLSATTQTSGTFTVEPLQNSLPVSGVVTNLHVHVVSPLTSSSNASITIGNTASATAYAGSALYSVYTNNYTKNAGQLASAALWDDTNDVAVPYLLNASNKTDLTFTTVGAVTGGKIYFLFDYFVPTSF